jgi:hypothetical protein
LIFPTPLTSAGCQAYLDQEQAKERAREAAYKAAQIEHRAELRQR